MKDTWCKPFTSSNGTRVTGAAAREGRIAAQGGMDRITSKREMRGYRSGYEACREDLTERFDDFEARLSQLEER